MDLLELHKRRWNGTLTQAKAVSDTVVGTDRAGLGSSTTTLGEALDWVPALTVELKALLGVPESALPV